MLIMVKGKRGINSLEQLMTVFISYYELGFNLRYGPIRTGIHRLPLDGNGIEVYLVQSGKGIEV